MRWGWKPSKTSVIKIQVGIQKPFSFDVALWWRNISNFPGFFLSSKNWLEYQIFFGVLLTKNISIQTKQKVILWNGLFDCVKNYSDRSFWKKCFVKITETLFWIVFPKTLASYRDIVVIQEGFEPREFWMKLGGREKYNIDRKKVQIFYSFYSYWCLSLSSR